MNLSRHLRRVLSIEPDAWAVVDGIGRSTWGELAGLTCGLTRVLGDAGVPPRAPIGVLPRNTASHVAALIGLISDARPISVVNSLQTPDGVAADVTALGLGAVIGSEGDLTSSAVTAAASEAGVPVVILPDHPSGRVSRVGGLRPTSSFPVRETREGTAIEMLTSGTTGRPKRIPLGYRQLERALVPASNHSEPRLGSGVVVVVVPPVHVSGFFGILSAVHAGRRLVLHDRFKAETWARSIEEFRPRTAALPPACLTMLLEAGISPRRLRSLETIRVGTAALPDDPAEEFEATYGISLLSVYGATEFAGAVIGWTRDLHARWMPQKRGSVGRPFPQVEVRVVDPETDRQCGTGELGVLEVSTSGTGWSRTTDLARIDDDGFVWIAGRADDVIIRGGFKVVPDEVRNVLEAHPAVRAASVVGYPDPRLGAVPIGVVELNEVVASPEALKEWCRQRLIGYQVPADILIIDALPRTPSEKVRRGEVEHWVRQALRG